MSSQRGFWACVIFGVVSVTLWASGWLSPQRQSDFRRIAPHIVSGASFRLHVRDETGSLSLRRKGDQWENALGDGLGNHRRITELEDDLSMTRWMRRRMWRGYDANLGLLFPRSVLTVTTEMATWTWRLGRETLEGESVWISDGMHAYLLAVDAAARLFPPSDELRQRRPFFASASSPIVRVVVNSRLLSFGQGQVSTRWGALPLSSQAERRVRSQLQGLTLARFAATDRFSPRHRIVVQSAGQDDAYVELGSPCSAETVAARTSLGQGCMETRDIETLLASLTESALVSRRVVPPGTSIESVQLDDGQSFAVAFDNQTLVSRWVQELGALFGELHEVVRPEIRAQVTFRAGGESHEWSLAKTNAGLLAIRANESVGFAVPNRATELFARSRLFFSRPGWANVSPEDVIAVRLRRGSHLAVDLKRGELLESWQSRGRTVSGAAVRGALARLFPLPLAGPAEAAQWKDSLAVSMRSPLEDDDHSIELQLEVASCAIRRSSGPGFLLAADGCAALKELTSL